MPSDLKEKLKKLYNMDYMGFDDGAKGFAQRAGHLLACSCNSMYLMKSLIEKAKFEQAHTLTVPDRLEYEPMEGS